MRMLFVCLGNICRSPMAEVVFAAQVAASELAEVITCDSAGTANYHTGGQADPRTRLVARNHGLNVTHRARQLTVQDFHDFDYIVAQDLSNFHNIQTLQSCAFGGKAQVVMMRQFEVPAQPAPDVPDPYYEDEQAFEDMYQMLVKASQALLIHVRQAHGL